MWLEMSIVFYIVWDAETGGQQQDDLQQFDAFYEGKVEKNLIAKDPILWDGLERISTEFTIMLGKKRQNVSSAARSECSRARIPTQDVRELQWL